MLSSLIPICIYVYVYIQICTYTFMCTYVYVMYVHLCMFVCLSIYLSIYLSIFTTLSKLSKQHLSKLQHFSNDAFHSYYDLFQVN